MTDDDGLLCLASGYHFVNRLGYLISTVPVEVAKSPEQHPFTVRAQFRSGGL
jgi:hypothetical protein